MTSLRSEPRRDGMVYCAYCTYVPYFTRAYTRAYTLREPCTCTRDELCFESARLILEIVPLDASALLLNYSRERFTSLAFEANGKGGGASIHDPLCSRLLDKANVKLAIQNSSQDLYNIFMNCLINFNSMFIERTFNQILLFNNAFRIHIFFCNKISGLNFRKNSNSIIYTSQVHSEIKF